MKVRKGFSRPSQGLNFHAEMTLSVLARRQSAKVSSYDGRKDIEDGLAQIENILHPKRLNHSCIIYV